MSLPPPTVPPGAIDYDTSNNDTHQANEDSNLNHDDDIYRGSPPPPTPATLILPNRPPSIVASEHHSSSSSSSDSSVGWRRGGPLAAVIEQAVTRWARRRASDRSSTTSSSSSSSSSSDSSTSDSTHRRSSHARSKKKSTRRGSTEVQRIKTGIRQRRKEREKRMRKAELVGSPQEFTLLLPLSLSPTPPATTDGITSGLNELQAQQQRIIRSPSLPLVLAQLDTALKKRAKLKRSDKKAKAVALQPPEMILEGSGTTTPEHPMASSSSSQPPPPPPRPQVRFDIAQIHQEKNIQPFWLDIASPSMTDMRELGKLFHLHPLTLEDITSREEREKLELFPRLGYYFIVFRALANINDDGEPARDAPPSSSGDKEKEGEVSEKTNVVVDEKGTMKEDVDEGIYEGDMGSGSVQAVNVYLVVFRQGVLSFHFGDVQIHTDRVRERILQFEDEVNVHLTSDWIAHGLLDSIVDAFFPVLDEIEKEVDALDAIANGLQDDMTEDNAGLFKMDMVVVGDDGKPIETPSPTQQSWLPFSMRGNGPWSLPLARKVKRKMMAYPIFHPILRHIHHLRRHQKSQSPALSSGGIGHLTTLVRMTTTRRLVTSLNRLLVAKHEVVGQIQKRVLAQTLVHQQGRRKRVTAGSELSMYMGDVQDHILSLQQSLDHFEKILSHSHPAYLNQLRNNLGEARAGMDKALFGLTVVTGCVALIQVITGVFSLNVQLPRNGSRKDPTAPAKLIVFALVLLTDVVMAIAYGCLLRWWWVRAEKKFKKRKAAYT